MRTSLVGTFDWKLLFITLALLAIGALNQASAALGGELFKRQLLWFSLGLALFGFLAACDYRKLFNPRLLMGAYGGLLLILVLLLFKHTRWLHIAGFGVQPSEFAKLMLIALFSLLLAQRKDKDRLDKRTFLLMSAFGLPPIFLVAATDLDQGGMLLLIYLSYLLIGGIPRRWAVGVTLLLLLLGVLVGPKIWAMLKPYQRARVEAFLNPEAYRLSRGYQIIQALIAVGSGGLTGLGFHQGLSSRLNFLPEKHTDLAFAVWAEEWGFLGAGLVLLLFGALIILILRTAQQVRDDLGRLLCFGVATMLFWEVVINAGGILHLLPVASVPLPFLSYGGSSVLVNLAGLGLVFSVSRRRYSFR